jgi:hypothetical protein
VRRGRRRRKRMRMIWKRKNIFFSGAKGRP